MKKSDMIEILAQLIYDNQEFDAHNYENILKGLLKAGMLAPFNENACYMDGDNANQESIKYCVWEG